MKSRSFRSVKILISQFCSRRRKPQARCLRQLRFSYFLCTAALLRGLLQTYQCWISKPYFCVSCQIWRPLGYPLCKWLETWKIQMTGQTRLGVVSIPLIDSLRPHPEEAGQIHQVCWSEIRNVVSSALSSYCLAPQSRILVGVLTCGSCERKNVLNHTNPRLVVKFERDFM